VADEDRRNGRVYPDVNNIRDVSLEVAYAVAQVAIKSNLSKKLSEKDLPNLKRLIASKMYNPLYVPLVHQPVRSTLPALALAPTPPPRHLASTCSCPGACLECSSSMLYRILTDATCMQKHLGD
jgi:hypothetical protein